MPQRIKLQPLLEDNCCSILTQYWTNLKGPLSALVPQTENHRKKAFTCLRDTLKSYLVTRMKNKHFQPTTSNLIVDLSCVHSAGFYMNSMADGPNTTAPYIEKHYWVSTTDWLEAMSQQQYIVGYVVWFGRGQAGGRPLGILRGPFVMYGGPGSSNRHTHTDTVTYINAHLHRHTYTSKHTQTHIHTPIYGVFRVYTQTVRGRWCRWRVFIFTVTCTIWIQAWVRAQR